MKKKLTALLLALALTLGLALPAAALPTDAPITICVGQIVSIRQLVEDMGYRWPPIPYDNVQTETSGAVTCTKYDSERLYGAAVGQGSVTVTITDQPPFTVNFNVVAASNPVVKNITMGPRDDFLMESQLAGMGYTAADIAQYTFWGTKTSYVMGLLGSSTYPSLGFNTRNNGIGESQILLNMTDGKIILFNVKISYTFQYWLERVQDSFRFNPLFSLYLVPLYSFQLIAITLGLKIKGLSIGWRYEYPVLAF